MNIKAIFPPGVSRLIVNGLHQWDYGRKLEIQSDDLPALVEVHFACAGMRDAVVRSCAVLNGVAEAAIPDQCLEQTTPITAWVYEVGETSGATVKTVVLPVIERTQPQPGATIPEQVSDKYTELIAAVNEQVGALQSGDITVNHALLADEATKADRAAQAGYADSAGTAGSADFASEAGVLESEWNLINNGSPVSVQNGIVLASLELISLGTYIFTISDYTTGASCAVMLVNDSYTDSNSSKANLQVGYEDGTTDNAELYVQHNNGKIYIRAFSRANPANAIESRFKVTAGYKRIA